MKISCNVDFLWVSAFDENYLFCIPLVGTKMTIMKRLDSTFDGFLYVGSDLIAWTKRIEDRDHIKSIMEGKFEKWMQGRFNCV